MLYATCTILYLLRIKAGVATAHDLRDGGALRTYSNPNPSSSPNPNPNPHPHPNPNPNPNPNQVRSPSPARPQ